MKQRLSKERIESFAYPTSDKTVASDEETEAMALELIKLRQLLEIARKIDSAFSLKSPEHPPLQLLKACRELVGFFICFNLEKKKV